MKLKLILIAALFSASICVSQKKWTLKECVDHALDNNINRLQKDHQRAFALAKALRTLDNVHIDINAVETNMVYMNLPEHKNAGLKPYLEKKNILISPAKQAFRLVIHKDIPEQAIEQFADAVASYMKEN